MTWSWLLILAIAFYRLIYIILWKIVTKLITFFEGLIKFHIRHFKGIFHKLFSSFSCKFGRCYSIFWWLFSIAILLLDKLIFSFFRFRNTRIRFSIRSKNFLLLLLLSCCSIIFLIFRRSMLTRSFIVLYSFLMIVNTILYFTFFILNTN